jgi:hypothetical protein
MGDVHPHGFVWMTHMFAHWPAINDGYFFFFNFLISPNLAKYIYILSTLEQYYKFEKEKH